MINEKPRSLDTYEEAVNYIAENIDKNTVNDPSFHHTCGMHIRNSLGLWKKDSKLYKHMLDRFGLCHADDTGSLITRAANALKNGIFYDPKEDVESFKTHWRNAGYDPATWKELSPL
jgi:hypothetical protein